MAAHLHVVHTVWFGVLTASVLFALVDAARKTVTKHEDEEDRWLTSSGWSFLLSFVGVMVPAMSLCAFCGGKDRAKAQRDAALAELESDVADMFNRPLGGR